jgi:hypothetical protein
LEIENDLCCDPSETRPRLDQIVAKYPEATLKLTIKNNYLTIFIILDSLLTIIIKLIPVVVPAPPVSFGQDNGDSTSTL